MPTGLDATGGWVDAPTDLPGFGDIQWEDAGSGWGRASIGGPDFPEAGMFTDPGQEGFNRIATGESVGPPIPGAGGRQANNWRGALNWEHSPTFWVMLFTLAAVGFIHARLQVGGSVGRLHAGGGVGL